MEKITQEEAQRRKQRVVQEVAALVGQARQLLVDARKIAEDNEIEINLQSIVWEVQEYEAWYGSDTSLC